MAARRTPDPHTRALRRAGQALSQRPLSEAQLRERLAGAAPDDVCDAVVADLREVGYVDDAALALALAEQRLGQGHGPLRLAADLKRLAVPAEAAEAALERARDGEVAAARALLVRRRLTGDRRRAYGLLVRRGFRPEVAEDVVGADHVDDVDGADGDG